jgi:hypothetical protein
VLSAFLSFIHFSLVDAWLAAVGVSLGPPTQFLGEKAILAVPLDRVAGHHPDCH